MADPVLPEEAKAFVVQSLACFDPPSLVMAAVKRDYGLTITRQAVQGYDPTKVSSKTLAKKWVELFHATRKAFLEDSATIAIASRGIRLRRLDRLYEAAERSGNAKLAAEILAQAAKETGNVFTNKAELSGAGGGAIQVERIERVIVYPTAKD